MGKRDFGSIEVSTHLYCPAPTKAYRDNYERIFGESPAACSHEWLESVASLGYTCEKCGESLVSPPPLSPTLPE